MSIYQDPPISPHPHPNPFTFPLFVFIFALFYNLFLPVERSWGDLPPLSLTTQPPPPPPPPSFFVSFFLHQRKQFWEGDDNQVLLVNIRDWDKKVLLVNIRDWGKERITFLSICCCVVACRVSSLLQSRSRT